MQNRSEVPAKRDGPHVWLGPKWSVADGRCQLQRYQGEHLTSNNEVVVLKGKAMGSSGFPA